MYIRFKKIPQGQIQITDIHGGLPFPHQYFKFTEENLPEQSQQWFDFLENKIFVVLEIVGNSPKLNKYQKYLQQTVEPVIIEKVKYNEKIKEEQEKQQEIIQKQEEIKQEVKPKSTPRKNKRVIKDQKEIEDKVKNFLKI